VDGADPNAELPCLWTKLRKLASRNRVKSGKKLHINDSKIVYACEAGLKALERGVLALLATRVQEIDAIETLLHLTAGEASAELWHYPWYQPFDGERFPLEQDFVSLRLFANALKLEMQANGVRLAHLASRIVHERQLNHLIQATRNKGSALFSTSAIHLDHLLRHFGEQGLVIFCDRQGGRAHYGALLRLMFEEWALEILEEKESRAEYRLMRSGHAVRILFCEKAESQCLPVAVASMLSKYTREALMTRFNAFWQRHLPDLAPTAGYYADGQRFLSDIHQKRQELGIADEQLIRVR
jgi:hypothetical protein